ncbi:MAG TPA: hypothetical protein VNR38_00635 [Ureibacillus sp.]|nr:hypothetical protein [Ureibacillus sp.]
MNELKIEMQLAQLFECIVQEVKVNKEFADRIRRVFNEDESDSHKGSGSGGRRKNRGASAENPVTDEKGLSSSTVPKRKSRKRNAALFNPESILEEQGEEWLLQSLNQLEVDQLKDIISEFGMDPGKRVAKCRKKEKFVSHIVGVTNNRLQKGTAFRKAK